MTRCTAFVGAALLLLPVGAGAEAPSRGSWGGDPWGGSPDPWFSFHAAGGASVMKGRPEILEGPLLFGSAVDLEAAFHLNDWLAFPAEFRYRAASAQLDELQARWVGYDTRTMMVGGGARIALLGTEFFELGATARLGLAFLSNEVIDRTDTFSWGASGPFGGVGIDASVFPFAEQKAIELGIGISGDAIFTRMKKEQLFAWETQPPEHLDISSALTLRVGWHL